MAQIQPNQKYGFLTVVAKTEKRKQGYVVWECRCECGNKVFKTSRELKRNLSISCGCRKTDERHGSRVEDLTGKVFGNLTVLHQVENRNGRTCWLCQCTCGKKKVTSAKDLKAGKVKSCGCTYRRHWKDLTGKSFGRLIVLHPMEKRDLKGSVVWRCRCDCGKEVDYSESQLIYGNYKSCGCLKQENQQKIHETLHMVDGTCVEMLEKRKSRRDNKSGFRGVTKMKSGRYRASIGFRGKRYHIGCYKTFDEAVSARLSAEKVTHDKFVQEYHEWEQKAKSDPEWRKIHPFRFQLNAEELQNHF